MPDFATYPSLVDRHVLITGGATGIGAGLVRAFHAQGAHVSFLDIDIDAGAALAADCPGRRPARFLPCDLRDIDGLQRAITAAEDGFGPVRVLINNAANDDRHSLQSADPAYWDNCQAINLRPHFFTAQAVAAGMRAAGGGSIINLSSNSWLLGLDGYPGYAAAKAGIVGLTRGLARELGGDNIRVNVLLPGWVMTDKQMDRWLTEDAEARLMEAQCLKEKLYPDDIARMALFLAADDSRLITAQSFIVDGGRA